jgi:hypothetical protein
MSAIGRGIVERKPEKRLAVGVSAGAAEHELIAVRRSLCHAGRPGHTPRAADILDDHLLAQELREARREYSTQHINPAARRQRNDHGHRSRRPVLRRGKLRGDGDYRKADGDRFGRPRLSVHDRRPFSGYRRSCREREYAMPVERCNAIVG